MLLYKYRSAITDFNTVNTKCNTARIFTASALYYAKPTTLNDPYEAHIEFDFSACEKKAQISHLRVLRERNRINGYTLETLHQTWDQVQRNVKEQMEHIKNKTLDFDGYYRDAMNNHGILSISEERNNLLMWAHYASEHKGMCLGFNWGKTGLPAAKEVTYLSSYRLVDFWAYTEDELAEIACFQKSAEWSYEREWRSLSYPTYERYKALKLTAEAKEKLEKAEAEHDDWMVKHIKDEHTFDFRRPSTFGYRAL
ncbi:DUF2971 domain-containing protein [Pusillimonas minor]|uniref:DUF2971 domain-containing protein n=1 Tax=Pusillimonas minor TaxID=2697024 RepID=A0A842HSD0_9BURK|nr:DUF2971 domain-containing protein [Pusillimonas minor]MBC2771066.1 DUF2971 domain-containing protein [Pusillimonas minor]